MILKGPNWRMLGTEIFETYIDAEDLLNECDTFYYKSSVIHKNNALPTRNINNLISYTKRKC